MEKEIAPSNAGAWVMRRILLLTAEIFNGGRRPFDVFFYKRSRSKIRTKIKKKRKRFHGAYGARTRNLRRDRAAL